MANARDTEVEAFHRILLVGATGSGKSTQMWTLPGKKFAYIFDPNSLSALRGADIDYERFLPDVQNVDMTIKGFNKNSVSDRPRTKKEPKVWNAWGDDFNKRYDEGFFKQYDWLCFDSFTFVTKAIMDRNLFINNRYGDIEDIGDYRVVGSKMAEVFGTIAGMDINIFATGHLDTFQDEDTKKIKTQLMLPGKARKIIPLQFTDIWQTKVEEDKDGKLKYLIRTIPDPKGLLDIRSSMQGLAPEEDITIRDFRNPDKYGIGKLVTEKGKGPLKGHVQSTAERTSNGLRENRPGQRPGA